MAVSLPSRTSALIAMRHSPSAVSKAIAGARAQVDKLPNGVRIHREVRNVAPSPLHRSLGTPDGVVDRWWTYDYTLPGILLLDSGVRPSSGGSGPRLHFHSCQAIVPE